MRKQIAPKYRVAEELGHIRQKQSKIIGDQEKPFGEDDDEKIFNDMKEKLIQSKE